MLKNTILAPSRIPVPILGRHPASGRRVYLLVRAAQDRTIRPEDKSIAVEIVVHRALLAPKALAGLIFLGVALILALSALLVVLPAVTTTSFVTVLSAVGVLMIRASGQLLVPGEEVERLRLNVEAAAQDISGT